jgi:thymidylate kinase
MITHLLSRKGETCLIRSHPNMDNPLGRRAHSYLFMEGRKAHIAASLFYLADVYRSIVLYWWRRVDCVIFVRYLLGTAYLPSPLHKLAYRFFSRLVPGTPYMIYIKVSPTEAERRVTMNRSSRERFETLDELKKISLKAWELVNLGGWIIIDGDRKPEDIHLEIMKAIELERVF